MTNIDRLHKVVTGEISGRGAGKTFASCHEVAGIVELGKEKQIFVITKFWRDRSYIKPMLWQILQEHGLKTKAINDTSWLCRSTRIDFVPSELFEEGRRGRDNYYVVNMIDY